MAVSQYLRPGSLLESVHSYLTPNVIHSASSLVGESESSTRQAMPGAVAGVLSGITNMASSREGASNLAGMIRDGGYANVIDKSGSFLGAGGTAASVLSSGQGLLGKIFGGNAGAASEAVGRSSGMRPGSAGKLMALVAPLAMSVLAKRTASERLDSGGLANLLAGEKSDIMAAAPAGFSNILSRGPSLVERGAVSSAFESAGERGITDERITGRSDVDVRQARGDVREPVRLEHFADPSVAEAPPPVRHRTNWWPLLIAGLVALAIIWALMSRARRPNTNVTVLKSVPAAPAPGAGLEQLQLPGGRNISLAPGSLNYNLAKFLGDPNSQTPHTFTFDNLNFEEATTQLTPASTSTINSLATILTAYPNAHVQLVGHTDNTGDAQANQVLSQNRANAVKSMLVGRGVDAGRITTQGMGQNSPTASNDTAEGQARNRRTELIVTQK